MIQQEIADVLARADTVLSLLLSKNMHKDKRLAAVISPEGFCSVAKDVHDQATQDAKDGSLVKWWVNSYDSDGVIGKTELITIGMVANGVKILLDNGLPIGQQPCVWFQRREGGWFLFLYESWDKTISGNVAIPDKGKVYLMPVGAMHPHNAVVITDREERDKMSNDLLRPAIVKKRYVIERKDTVVREFTVEAGDGPVHLLSAAVQSKADAFLRGQLPKRKIKAHRDDRCHDDRK